MSYRTAHERLWDRVDRSAGPDACWEWQGTINSHGYGTIRDRCRSRGTHVIAFEIANGPASDSVVCHTCDNRKCCNPAHLYAGTHTTNARDRVARNRSNPARGEQCAQAKLGTADASLIRYLVGCGVQQRRLAQIYGVSKMAVSNLVGGKSWVHAPPLVYRQKESDE